MFKSVLAVALAALAAAVQSQTYAIDPSHTAVIFEADHYATSTNRGRFAAKEGSVTIDRAGHKSSVEVIVDMASLITGVAALDRQLQGKNFFNVAEHPVGRFVASGFSFADDRVTEVSGALTLLGTTQPVTLRAMRFNCYRHPLLKREVCGGDFETTIRRSRWGITRGLDSGFQDEVRLLVQVEAIAQ